MKLRALELEQFRKFDRGVRIAGMADGLNLVVGPNEMGKSTLFAALQAALFERHRSQAQTVKSLQPAGHDGASPRVALSFEIGGGRYRIEKRFLRRPSAELSLPDGRQLHGEAAEEALEALLAGGDAVGQIGGRRSALDAQGVWSLLWVGQGQSFVQPEIAAGTRSTLQGALEGEIGEILSGVQGTVLIGELERAEQELVYRTRKPRGRYKEADDARRALEVEIADLEARCYELERDRNDLDAVRAEYQRLKAEQSSGQEEVQLVELATRRDRLTVQRAEIREAEAALATARHGLAQAELERARRQGLREVMAAADAELAETTAAAAETAAAAVAGDGLATEQTSKVERLQAMLDQAENHRRGLQRLAEAIRQRDDGRAALRAAASEVALELEPAALDRVLLDGRPLGVASRSLRIVDPLEIVIAGVGRIRVRPVVADRRRLQGSLRDAERRIARELEVLGLRPPAARARQLEFELAAGGPAFAGQPAELGAGGTDAPSWPEAAPVETAQAEAERQISGLAAQLRPARRALDHLLEDRHRRRAARDQAAERSEQAERRCEELRAELAAAERKGDEAALVARVAELQGEVAIAELRLRQLQERLPAEALEVLERRMLELRQVVDGRAVALRQRELALEGLRARIQALAGGGLDERLAGARRRLDEIERECAKYGREAAALGLLLRVLRDAERDAKERYVGPLLRRIRPYLQALFPGCELGVDEAFRITTIARAGVPEPFERLSDGTREQIAILTRLAFAGLLAEQGRPAVVVLDDALVFADDQRIERMFEILADAARQFQIIVLTCRERVFQDLAAHRLRLEQVQAAGVH
jgi:DNA repair exonuclease SbcCD ATPase subunit